eukprot:3414171-Amphidinium_carterae.1
MNSNVALLGLDGTLRSCYDLCTARTKRNKRDQVSVLHIPKVKRYIETECSEIIAKPIKTCDRKRLVSKSASVTSMEGCPWTSHQVEVKKAPQSATRA